ncbi:hypothetical protein FOZ61_002301, partial [Perkinsus olseni]
NKKASLFVDVVIGKDQGQRVLQLDVVAQGSVTVWQMGEGVSLSIDVSVDGKVSDDTVQQTITAQIQIAVTFSVNLPVVGSIMDCTVYAKIGITAAPNNVITAYGEIGKSISLGIAGAGAGVNIKGNTLDNQPNKWALKSEAFLVAWVNLGLWSEYWRWAWEIWHASPVYF